LNIREKLKNIFTNFFFFQNQKNTFLPKAMTNFSLSLEKGEKKFRNSLSIILFIIPPKNENEMRSKPLFMNIPRDINHE
jgi:hypothetical protein